MQDVLFVCVGADLDRAEALAKILDDLGFSISDAAVDDDGIADAATCVVIWSDAARRSTAFQTLLRHPDLADRAIVLSFEDGAAPPIAAALYNLSEWEGDPVDAVLDPIVFAIEAAAGQEAAPAIDPASVLHAWQVDLPTDLDPVAALARSKAAARRKPFLVAARAVAVLVLLFGATLSSLQPSAADPAPIVLDATTPEPLPETALDSTLILPAEFNAVGAPVRAMTRHAQFVAVSAA